MAAVNAKDVVNALLCSSEKAAMIARAFRSLPSFTTNLVQEKLHLSKKDFKTVADVLIQEAVRLDLANSLGFISDHILGEEQPEFKTMQGQDVSLALTSSVNETASQLAKILSNDAALSDKMAALVHQQATVLPPNIYQLPIGLEEQSINVASLGVWIDPIDATNEYIQPENETADSVGGVRVVTVLIGVFDWDTGVPLFGVINQPFHVKDEQLTQWTGRAFWGFCSSPTLSAFTNISPQHNQEDRFVAVLSSSESTSVQDYLKNKLKWTLSNAPGAGYKLLLVVLGEADAYIVSKPSTYRWDTCAAHAILRALGGDIVIRDGSSLSYKLASDQIPANDRGILAHIDKQALLALPALSLY